VIRVLVVEDDFRVAQIHVAFARRVPGVTVVGAARSSGEARAFLRDHPVDLLLLDCYLPDQSGLDLLHDGDRPTAPKGQSPVTSRLVADALRAAGCARSAADVAAELGISRATAQRYLAALAQSGDAEMTLRYGTTGRPEHRYRWRSG
jgi:response regulator of citrate/malate metabolism